MEYAINHIELCGTMETPPVFSHENHGRRFYRFELSVRRLSGAADRLPVLVSRELLEQTDVSWGERIYVSGQIRSYNQRTPLQRRLVISVYAEQVELSDAEPDNRVTLAGAVCREPVFRRTPLGREICDIMLAVERPYHRTDYLPCIFWGRTARDVAELPVGAAIALEGRLQSREYTKLLDDGTALHRTAYEISAMSAQPVGEMPDEPVC